MCSRIKDREGRVIEHTVGVEMAAAPNPTVAAVL
jgi:hypothetical protein